MNYFENVQSPVSFPPTPSRREINEMVARVEQRAIAEMKMCNSLVEKELKNCWCQVDPYFMVSPEDSFDWMCLYVAASKVNIELASILWYIRGCGTRLEKSDQWGYVLKPDIQEGGWESWEHWDRDKHELLDRYGKLLIDLLQETRLCK